MLVQNPDTHFLRHLKLRDIRCRHNLFFLYLFLLNVYFPDVKVDQIKSCFCWFFQNKLRLKFIYRGYLDLSKRSKICFQCKSWCLCSSWEGERERERGRKSDKHREWKRERKWKGKRGKRNSYFLSISKQKWMIHYQWKQKGEVCLLSITK